MPKTASTCRTSDRPGMILECQAVEQRGESDKETCERTGCSHIEQCATRPKRRADKNEGSEGPNDRRKRNKKRIAGVDAMAAACKKMAKFMREQNHEQSDGERQASEQCGWVSVRQRKGTNQTFQ